MSWRVQLKKQHTGYRKYWVINDATKEDYYVYHTWFSQGDVFERKYYNQKWDCTCGHENCAHIDIAKQWLKDERAKDRAGRKKMAQEEKITADEVNQRIDERRVRPHVSMPPLEELPAMTADEYIAKMKGVPYVPAQPPKDPSNCEYWQEESWAQWCKNRDGSCPHKFNLCQCKLRMGPGVYRKVLV